MDPFSTFFSLFYYTQKHDFGLTIDIEELIRAIDTDGSGEIEFEEFKTLLS